ncbi:MAG: cytochrome c [Rhodobacteraceae bacterium]|nr:cytochrome c [Paracoccaceae bacterium]
MAAAIALTTSVAGPSLGNEAAIKGRKAMMQTYAFNIGQLGAMAKGVAEYNSEAAAAAAGNLLAAAKFNQMAMWPQGTDMDAMPDKTEALSVIWTTFPAVLDKSNALIEAATAMNEAAGKDLASLQGAMGALGGACGGCHKVYRKPKDQ